MRWHTKDSCKKMNFRNDEVLRLLVQQRRGDNIMKEIIRQAHNKGDKVYGDLIISEVVDNVEF